MENFLIDFLEQRLVEGYLDPDSSCFDYSFNCKYHILFVSKSPYFGKSRSVKNNIKINVSRIYIFRFAKKFLFLKIAKYYSPVLLYFQMVYPSLDLIILLYKIFHSCLASGGTCCYAEKKFLKRKKFFFASHSRLSMISEEIKQFW